MKSSKTRPLPEATVPLKRHHSDPADITKISAPRIEPRAESSAANLLWQTGGTHAQRGLSPEDVSIPAIPTISLPESVAEFESTSPKTEALSPTDSSRKRPRPQIQTSVAPKFAEPARKKQKHNRLSLTDFGIPSLSASGPSINLAAPPSPLFFSNSPRLRPELPARFSSSEAGAKMLSKTKGEDTGVKTVTLARGSVSQTHQRLLGRPSPKSRSSTDRGSLPRSVSSETTENSESGRLLAQIGISELLEQDDRPTFIIDLGDNANYTGGPLHKIPLNIIFANTALRSCQGLLESLSGNVEHPSSNPLMPRSFPKFREWVLSGTVNGESIGVKLPDFVQSGSVSWSSTTLRQRFRIVRGSVLSSHGAVTAAAAVTATSSTIASSPTLVDSRTAEYPDGGPNEEAVESSLKEPQDYFGLAGANLSPEIGVHPSPGQIAPSIETPESPGMSTSIEIPNSVGSLHETVSAEALNEASDELDTAEVAPVDVSTAASFDWTRLPVSDALPDHIRFARSVDWAATSLGPIETWSPDLRQMCNLIMASPHPAAMYWGQDLVAIYNEAYVLLAGQKHPTLMGQSYRVAWAEIWDEVKDVFAGAQLTGQATMKDDDCLFIRRHDFLEEVYFSWSIIPMVGGEGSVMGLYNPAFEKTRRKIAERRMLTLREVGERTATARDVKAFWTEVLAALETNELDTPFVLLYSIGDDSETDSASVTSSSVSSVAKQCFLEGSLGVPEGHPAAAPVLDLRGGTSGFVMAFRETMKTNRPALLEVTTDIDPPDMLEGLEWRGFGDACKSVVVCPIHPTTGDSTLGYLVMGINPRRPYDDDYSLFIQLLSRQLATSLASVVLFEEEIRRGQRAAKMAALDRIELSEQLAARTQEAIDSETKFTRMAEFAPVGMFIANSEGRITYCNDTWYEITRVPKNIRSTDKWVDYVRNEDKPLIQQVWRDLIEKTKPATAEFRFKAPWIDRDGNQGDTWVLFSAYPETKDSGALKSVFGSITNISEQKWAEGLQKRKTEEAVELKRQQENFIDMTSHELRNPLSAIMLCADTIVNSLTTLKSLEPSINDSLIDGGIDAAETIAHCAQHQKRIVDDVLTLSKLDSMLLVVTPVEVQPVAVVQRALKVFDGELQSANISMDFVVDPSFRKLRVDWVKCDPSRVQQVLINLITNAIKFTGSERRKHITVRIAASLHRPTADDKTMFTYLPSTSKRLAMTSGSDWGQGDIIYIHFSVQDTGRGLGPEEKKMLFLRFSQASPRTHVQYGGSGLGLFISRELTELQGGEIGVASEAGKGSTFAFFIQARRAVAPYTSQSKRKDSQQHGSESAISPNDAHAPSVRDFATAALAVKTRTEPLKVLIVEDNLVNQRVLEKQLITLGCRVVVANHGGEALEKLSESWFAKDLQGGGIGIDVVLMDQEMPIMDGITCTKRVRELEEKGELVRHVPIIAVTANARSEQIEKAMEAGMDDVVSKPFRIPELMEKMLKLGVAVS